MRSGYVSSLLVALLVATVASGATPAQSAASAPELSGQVVVNGAKASLAYVRVVAEKDSTGTLAYRIVLSEKDASKSVDPRIDAEFGKLGDAFIIGVTSGGENFSNVIVLTARKGPPFSVSGDIGVEGFRIDGGQLNGRFFTKKERDFFGERISFDVKVRAPLPRTK